jgi:septin family protein
MGMAGKGKSSLLNLLVSGNHKSNVFEQKRASTSITRKISMRPFPIFGFERENRIFNFIDVPGFLDGTAK